MPTGYTAALCEKEVPFQDFVMQCARAMGACVMMREDPLDAPIPERFEPSDFYLKNISEAESEIGAIEKLSEKEAAEKAHAEYSTTRERYKEMIAKCAATSERLRNMRRLVEAWAPPTPEHEGFKKFMLEQLDSTIQFDGDSSYYEKALRDLLPPSGPSWKKSKLDDLHKNLLRYQQEWRDEQARTESRNKWLADLRDSLRTHEQTT